MKTASINIYLDKEPQKYEDAINFGYAITDIIVIIIIPIIIINVIITIIDFLMFIKDKILY